MCVGSGKSSELAVKSEHRARWSSRLRHAGEQLRQGLDIAPKNRDLIENLRLHFRAEVRGRLFYQRRFGLHVDRLRELSDLQASVDRNGGAGLHLNATQFQSREALALKTHRVSAGHQFGAA